MKRKMGVVVLTLCLLIGAFLGGVGLRYWGEGKESSGSPDDYVQEKKEPQEIKQVALTFDDGPSETYTGQLLDGLKERNVKATFFVIGMYAEEHPDLIRRMTEEGHVIGNHTYHHVQLGKLTDEQAEQELNMTNEVLESITGERPVFARPPFGDWNKKKDFPAELIPVLWNVDPLDWKVQNTNTVVKHILTHVEDGDIILLHDSYATSVKAAFQCIDLLKEQGYQFVTVDELMFG